MSVNVYQIITDRIIEQLKNGRIPWRKPWISINNRAVSHSTGKPYSILNQMLLNKPGEYLTFNQVKQAGGHVRKGEKSSFVVFWRIYQKEEVVDGKSCTTTIPLLKYINVFHIDQCEGVKPRLKQPEFRDDFNPVAEAERIAAEYSGRTGVKIINAEQNEVYYSHSNDEIHLPLKEQFKADAEYYSTLFHEMAHSTGAKNRLDRFPQGHVKFGDTNYSKEELVAEIAAAAMMNTLGIETDETTTNTDAYLLGWLNALQNDPKMIVSAASKAEKAVNFILNKEDTKQEEPAA